MLITIPLPRLYADPIKRKLLEHPDPTYPPEAKRLRIEGAVILRIVIEPDGHVSDVRVASGNPLLVPAAQSAAKLWRYSPDTEQTATVVQISFTLK